MKIIQVYGNGTIRLPQEIITKLSLKKGDKLVIETKHDGFAVCKVEYYQDWVKRFDAEILELDNEFKQLFAKFMNYINKKDENLEDKQETEVL